MERKCENCEFWEKRIYGISIAATGNCCWNPPANRDLGLDGHPKQDSWPSKTREFEWCGQFKEKQNV